jgi:two-component system OmpR family response regulator/two-component system response regulator QseB
MRALQRRNEGRVAPVLCAGNVELDPAGTVVRQDGIPVAMTAKEFRILKLLVERAGKYVTKRDIEYAVYSSENSVESNTVEVAIYALRRKLGTAFIKTIRGVGYTVDA